jgi:hypothetical protein
MHHTLKFYSKNRRNILRFYMFFATWTKVPLLGRLVRYIGNRWSGLHNACLLTLPEAKELVQLAEGVASSECSCRKVFRNCDNPRDNEILLGPTRHIFEEAMPEDSREIDKQAAVDILEESHRNGLILTAIQCRGDYYAICSCCSCCCVPLRLNKQYGIGDALVRRKGIVQEFVNYQREMSANPHPH